MIFCKNCEEVEDFCAFCTIVDCPRMETEHSNKEIINNSVESFDVDQKLAELAKEFQLTGVDSEELASTLSASNSLDQELLVHVSKAARMNEQIDALLSKMTKYHKKDLVVGSKESKTMDTYIRTLRTNGLDWLINK